MTTQMRYRSPSGDAPCGECPFRRRAPAGWLGANTPQALIVEISLERPLPCHPTIDYGDPGWLEAWNAQSTGRICAGSLIMSANMGKLPRDRAFPRLPADDAAVFGSHLEFIAHHEQADVRSWEMDEDAPRERREKPARRQDVKNAKDVKTSTKKKALTGARARGPRTTSRVPKLADLVGADEARPPVTRESYVERVRRALELDDVNDLPRLRYIDALRELRDELDSMIDAATEEAKEAGELDDEGREPVAP